jgi:hypothetical protein
VRAPGALGQCLAANPDGIAVTEFALDSIGIVWRASSKYRRCALFGDKREITCIAPSASAACWQKNQRIECWEPRMDQTVLFFLFLLAMVVAWFGPRPLSVTIFGIALVLTVADFFHHATSALTLSF